MFFSFCIFLAHNRTGRSRTLTLSLSSLLLPHSLFSDCVSELLPYASYSFFLFSFPFLLFLLIAHGWKMSKSRNKPELGMFSYITNRALYSCNNEKKVQKAFFGGHVFVIGVLVAAVTLVAFQILSFRSTFASPGELKCKKKRNTAVSCP